jgi:hypothetical protein
MVKCGVSYIVSKQQIKLRAAAEQTELGERGKLIT